MCGEAVIVCFCGYYCVWWFWICVAVCLGILLEVGCGCVFFLISSVFCGWFFWFGWDGFVIEGFLGGRYVGVCEILWISFFIMGG